ncbi:hypothetical protein BGZ68_000058 [Mortierella alpina]|nr:hypothetical protein BGZ68_000058 [Mortierella alpina]
MYKFSIILSLAFVIGSVRAAADLAVNPAGNATINAANDAEMSLNFWNIGGDPTYCLDFNFDQCYTFSESIAAEGLSSARFNNYDFWVRKFSITVYSGSNCNYAYDRWSFTTTQHNSYFINQFPTLNDKVRSFKVANFHTSTDSGTIGAQPELATMSKCFQK